MGHVALAAPLPLPLYHIATSYVSSQKPLDVSPLSAPPLSPYAPVDLANPRLIFFCMCHVELFSTRKIFEIYLSNILLQFLQGVWQKGGGRGCEKLRIFQYAGPRFSTLFPASHSFLYFAHIFHFRWVFIFFFTCFCILFWFCSLRFIVPCAFYAIFLFW